MNNLAVFPSKPVRSTAVIANTAMGSVNTSAPTNTVILVGTGANAQFSADGSVLVKLQCTHRATTTAATIVWLFRKVGAVYTPLAFCQMPMQTVDGTNMPQTKEFTWTSSSDPRGFNSSDELAVGVFTAPGAEIIVHAEFYNLSSNGA